MNLQQLETKLSLHPESPLFIRVAQEYLIGGQIEKAKELCHSGLERFPSYVTALLVLSKCYAAERQFDAAVQLLRQVITVYPTSDALQALLADWKEKNIPQPKQAEPVHADEQLRITEVAIESQTIVSKTLAEIYVSQGQFDEAIRTYKLLKQRQPVKQNEFEQRIRELTSEMAKLRK